MTAAATLQDGRLGRLGQPQGIGHKLEQALWPLASGPGRALDQYDATEDNGGDSGGASPQRAEHLTRAEQSELHKPALRAFPERCTPALNCAHANQAGRAVGGVEVIHGRSLALTPCTR